MAFEWTPTNIGHLRDMWAKGLTASQIALALGTGSRNAIMGKAHRLGLAGRPSPLKPKGSGERPGRNRKRPLVAAKPRRVAAPEMSLPLVVPPKPRAVPVVAYTGAPVRFNQLQAGQCKWISEATTPGRADEALACAAPIAGIGCPWCAPHLDLARGHKVGALEGMASIDLGAARMGVAVS